MSSMPAIVTARTADRPDSGGGDAAISGARIDPVPPNFERAELTRRYEPTRPSRVEVAASSARKSARRPPSHPAMYSCSTWDTACSGR